MPLIFAAFIGFSVIWGIHLANEWDRTSAQKEWVITNCEPTDQWVANPNDGNTFTFRVYDCPEGREPPR